ncbi:hypothetical protein NUW58_g285 [Xylaria curta]|uniref:Uncharacterized protein n=2 Tax=Xylaria curta TaxID=42375 RepID=A0ACC1PIE0_9PEZI|nr:hypothetical protein NUW58_g2517 [Xylaria curta]KAJ2998567.1 hypothetical protein NUW58_g285 [Xylaria curta]
MSSTLNHLAGSLFLATMLVLGVKAFLIIIRKKPGPLPPGPKGLPFLGNIADLPKPGEPEWEHWLKHKDTYGPISSVTVLGKTQVIIHSPELVVELFEKRSLKYSSRPKLPFAESTGLSELIGLMPYNKEHRASRKLVHTTLGTQHLSKHYLDIQEKEAHRFLFRVLQKPDLFMDHLRSEAGAIILKIVYGYTIDPHKLDPLVQLVDKAMEHFSASITPGAWLVDLIPALQYLPEWMPGAGWKKISRNWRATITDSIEKPLRFARKRQASGNAEASLVSDFYNLRGDSTSAAEDKNLKTTAGTMYYAGADTTVNTISVFFLNMALFPEVQRKAQEEIDRVIGNTRLPLFSDRESLPYVNAVITESLRWHPVVPLSLPHTTDADDVVNGYHIPKGSSVIANVWWFTHDPEVYPNPSEFNPSRFLGPNPAPDPANHVFGHGRRICPGRYLANTSIWLTVARTLAVFNISKSLDENGLEIEPTVKLTVGAITRVEPFKATIKPRSPHHETLIRQVEELYPWEESNADELEDTIA